MKAPDLTNPLVHSFDQVDTSACSVVLARVAGILKKKSFLSVHPWVQQMKPQGEQIRLVLSPQGTPQPPFPHLELFSCILGVKQAAASDVAGK